MTQEIVSSAAVGNYDTCMHPHPYFVFDPQEGHEKMMYIDGELGTGMHNYYHSLQLH